MSTLDNNQGRRSFFGKLGALIAATALTPSVLTTSGSLDEPKKASIGQDVRIAGGVEDSVTRNTIPLPDGFEIMELPTTMVNWKGKEVVVVSKTQKLRTQMRYNYDNPQDRGPHLVDYDELKAELTQLGYTHLYLIMYTHTLYNPANFEPKVHLVVRGCCLK